MLGSDRLHTWLVFAEDASLSRAAQRLHLSQPAVHAQLRALSEEVGVPLYTREGRGLALTREGAELATFARELDERTGELLARLRGEHDDRSLILAAGAGALVHVLPVGLRAFARRHPATAIEVVSANAQQAAQLVRSGLAHVGVGVLDPAPDDLEHQVLAHAAQTIVVPRAHRLASKRSVKLRDLEGETLILPPAGGAQRIALDAALSEVTVHVAAAVRGWDVVLQLVQAGVGLGIVNDTCALPKPLVGRVLRELPTITYRAFTRPRPRAAARALVHAFAEHARTRKNKPGLRAA